MTIEQDEKIADEATQGKWYFRKLWDDLVSIETDSIYLLKTKNHYLTTENGKYIANFNPERIKKYIAVAKAAEHAKKQFMAIDDGFFTGLVPPEFGGVCKALKELENE